MGKANLDGGRSNPELGGLPDQWKLGIHPKLCVIRIWPFQCPLEIQTGC